MKKKNKKYGGYKTLREYKLAVNIAFEFVHFYNDYAIFKNPLAKKATIRVDKYAKKVMNLIKKYETRHKSV